MREDREFEQYAIDKGFTVDDSTQARNGLSFNKGVVHIWSIREGWQCADLIDGYYKNHRPYDSLKEALDGENKKS